MTMPPGFKQVNRRQALLDSSAQPGHSQAMWRRWLILIVILGFLPQVWLRDPRSRDSHEQAVALTALPVPPLLSGLGPFHLTGAWRLDSANRHFGGYSGLTVPRAGWLSAFSDQGRVLDLPQPGMPGKARQFPLFGAAVQEKGQRDVEAASFDPESGATWIALERNNALLRLDRLGRADPADMIQPAPMRKWPDNSGPEAMVRLRDGRFLVVAEADAGWSGSGVHQAFRFAAEPNGQPGTAQGFAFVGTAGFRPSDMAQLPDGRVLVLLRRLRWPMPPRFGTRIVLANPAEIVAGKPWQSIPLASLDGTGLEENYEGLAIEPAADGKVTVWLISDSNGAVTQRNLLLRFLLDPAKLPAATGRAKQKAPG
jgi:hypothetical protein